MAATEWVGLTEYAPLPPEGSGAVRLLILLVVLLVCWPTTPSWAAPATARPWYVAIAQRYLGPPAVYQGNVAFEAQETITSDPQSHLFVSSIATFSPREVYSAAPGRNIVMVRLSSSWIVWEEETQFDDWTINAMDRSSSVVTQVASSQVVGRAPHPWMFPLLSLSGSTVAWSQARCNAPCVTGLRPHDETWTSSIRYRDLPAGRVRVVWSTNAPCNQYWPTLWNRTLVWHQEGICGHVNGTDIMMVSLPAGGVRVLTHNHRSSEASTNGTFVAWKVAPSRFSNGRIMLLNLRSGKLESASIRRPGSQSCGMSRGRPVSYYCDAEPVLSQRALSWWADGGASMLALSLVTGKTFALQSDKGNFGPDLLGVGWGHIMAWAASRTGDNLPYPKRYIGFARVP